MAEKRKYEKDLYKLSELSDFEVADKDPDVRGWKVLSADGVRFGKIEDLIVDPNHMKVRYLEVDVDKDYEGVKENHHLLIPIGAAMIHEKDDTVMINTIQTRTLLDSPPYEGMEITRDYEEKVSQSYWPDRAPGSSRSDEDPEQQRTRLLEEERAKELEQEQARRREEERARQLELENKSRRELELQREQEQEKDEARKLERETELKREREEKAELERQLKETREELKEQERLLEARRERLLKDELKVKQEREELRQQRQQRGSGTPNDPDRSYDESGPSRPRDYDDTDPSRPSDRPRSGDDYYDSDEFDDSKFYRSRRKRSNP